MPSEVESPMYATALQEDMVGDAALRGSCDFCSFATDSRSFGSRGCSEVRAAVFGDIFSGAGVLSGATTVRCVETLGCAGPFRDRAASPVLSAVGPTTPVKPAQSNASTATATTDTTPVTTGRRGRSLASPLRPSLDLVCVQILPRAPQRIGSSKNCQERAATTMVATTWRTSRVKLAFCCWLGAVSTMMGKCHR